MKFVMAYIVVMVGFVAVLEAATNHPHQIEAVFSK